METATAFASSSVMYVGGTGDVFGGNNSVNNANIYDAYLQRYGTKVFAGRQQGASGTRFVASEDDIKIFDSALFSYFKIIDDIL